VLSMSICLTFQMDYDTSMAFTMLRASSAAYCDDTQLQTMGCGAVCNDLSGYQFERQYDYQIPDYESLSFSTFFNHDENLFVVSFRGTKGIEQLIDELLHSRAVSYEIHDIQNAVVTGYFYDKYTSYIRDDFLSAVQQAAVDYPDYQFYIAGHSLGGAFATLAALDASLSGVTSPDNIHLYTYGCPRVGNFALAQAVVNNVGQIYRVTHHKDIVPHIPPCNTDWTGQCQADPDIASENGVELFHAWHVWPEVFYSSNTTDDFKICYDGEDLTCSDQFATILDSINDHLLYLGLSTGC